MPALLRAVIGSTVVSIALAGCSGPSSAPRSGNGASVAVDPAASEGSVVFPPRAPYVTAGERMSYRVSLHDIDAATFTVSIGELDELAGRPVVVVQSGITSSALVSMVRKIDDNFTSWIDAETTRPVLFRSSELASPKDQVLEVTDSEAGKLQDGAFPVRVNRGGVDQAVEQQAVGELPVFDLNGFLIALRSWEVPAGTKGASDVIRSRFLWRTEVTMGGFENVVTELGELPALRIDGVSQRIGRDGAIDPKSSVRRYSLWISNDADRVPLQMVAHTDYGDLRMDIVEYSAGNGTRIGR
jgi:hypothetical protein